MTQLFSVGRPAVSIELNGEAVDALEVVVTPGKLVFRFPGEVEAIGTSRIFSSGFEEWQWLLRNHGEGPSPVISRFRPLVLGMQADGILAPRLHGSAGGIMDSSYPPASWTQSSPFIATEGWCNPIKRESSRGRSSNKDLPLFVVEDGSRQGGFVIALGWSGDWNLEMSRNGESIQVEAGMTNLATVLEPGEEVMQPTVLYARYVGTAEQGKRALRNHLRDETQPRLDGAAPRPVTWFDNFYGDGGNFDATDLADEISAGRVHDIDYLVVDGGWNGGEDGFLDLVPHIGTWVPDAAKYPNGIAPLRELAEAAGQPLGVWVDFEHGHPLSTAVREHPELFFPAPLDDFGCQLLNLGDPEAQEWAIDTVSGVIDLFGARWLRLDFNADPGEIWEANDPVNRRGISEIRYLEGLYRVFDTLLEKYPSTRLENCASGGRRIDLETIRRSHTDWISDMSQSEAVARYNLWGASNWLPANRINTSFAHKSQEPHRLENWDVDLPASAYLSHFGGNFGVSDRLTGASTASREAFEHYVHLFRQTADIFAGDLIHIGRQENLLAGPAGYAARNPIDQRRAVLLFGVACSDAGQFVPEEFSDLVASTPVAGDEGSDQFVMSYLWFDPSD